MLCFLTGGRKPELLAHTFLWVGLHVQKLYVNSRAQAQLAHVSSGVNSGPFSLTWNSLKLCYWSHTAEELLREPDVLRCRAPKAPAREEAAHTACGSPLCTVLGGTCWLPPLPSTSIGAGCVPAGDLLAGL